MNKAKCQGFLCGPRIYEFDGWIFEDHSHSGPWPLTKDLLPRKRAGKRFYRMYAKFNASPDKEQFRIGGGCVRL